MLWNITNSDYNHGHYLRNSCINPKHIECITTSKTNRSKIKIHLISGKEFVSDRSCLTELEKLLGITIEY